MRAFKCAVTTAYVRPRGSYILIEGGGSIASSESSTPERNQSGTLQEVLEN